jgi:hypothetical protein
VRNTPVLVNGDLDAVTEYLGEDYPLYHGKKVSLDNIKAAHDYLVAMDKTRFMISSFMNEFCSSSVYQSL